MDSLKIQEYEAKRAKISEQTKKPTMAGFILLALGGLIIVVTLLLPDQYGFVMWFGLISLFAGAGLLFWMTSKKTKFLKEFKKNFVKDLVADLYPGSTFDTENGMPLKEVLAPGFFKDPDRYNTYDYLKANYQGLPIEMTGFDLKEERRSTDSEGHTTVTYETYAKGKLIMIDIEKDIKDTVKVLETKWLGANLRGLHKIETESIDFNKKFVTYTSNDLTTFYLLTPQIQLKLLEMENMFRGTIFYAFYDGKFYVAINDNNDSFVIDVNKPLTGEGMDKLVSELSLPVAIINELKFTSSKFKN